MTRTVSRTQLRWQQAAARQPVGDEVWTVAPNCRSSFAT